VAVARGYSAASSTATLQVAKKSDLNVYAAASLADALGRVGEAFTNRYLNISVKFNFAGSSTLITQIQQGAPADIVIAADTSNIDKLVASGLVATNAVVTLVNNKLAILVPRGNPAKISSLADLTRSGLKVVLCDTSQPCGKYATTALANAKIVLTPAGREASASAVVSRIASGEADAGIAYVTDGLVSGDKVDPVVIPEAVNVVATYPIAALKSPSTRDVSAIGAFIAMARGSVGDAIFSKAGFIVP
jgi:molybdate transport system substrate-binding protein